MLVWLALSILNCSMVSTFRKHNFFYEDPRYIMFICMVINDGVQLTLVTALYVVSTEMKYRAKNDLKDIYKCLKTVALDTKYQACGIYFEYLKEN